MGHTFEQNRPDHQIHDKHIPAGHAHMDQKHHKGNRSPMLGQLPEGGETVAPDLAPGAGVGMGSVGPESNPGSGY